MMLLKKLLGQVPMVYEKGGSSGPSMAYQMQQQAEADAKAKILREDAERKTDYRRKYDKGKSASDKTLARQQWEQDNAVQEAKSAQTARMQERAQSKADYGSQSDRYSSDYSKFKTRKAASDELRSRRGMNSLLSAGKGIELDKNIAADKVYTDPTEDKYQKSIVDDFQTAKNRRAAESAQAQWDAKERERKLAYDQNKYRSTEQQGIYDASRKYDTGMAKFATDTAKYATDMAEWNKKNQESIAAARANPTQYWRENQYNENSQQKGPKGSISGPTFAAPVAPTAVQGYLSADKAYQAGTGRPSGSYETAMKNVTDWGGMSEAMKANRKDWESTNTIEDKQATVDPNKVTKSGAKKRKGLMATDDELQGQLGVL